MHFLFLPTLSTHILGSSTDFYISKRFNEISSCRCNFAVSFNFSLGTLAADTVGSHSKQSSSIPRIPSYWVTLLLNLNDAIED